MPLEGEHGVETGGELRVPVADQEPERPNPLPPSWSRLRACCTVHCPVGFALTPRICTRRVATSITNRTYSLRRVMVSTQKKSVASRPARPGHGGTSARSGRRGG